MTTNRELLEKAGILPKNLQLTPTEEKKLEKLTSLEIEFLKSIKKQIKANLKMDMLIAPPTHHF